MSLIRFLISFVLFIALGQSAIAKIQVETFTLSNGMEVVLLPSKRVPAVSHTLWLRVGSADDPAGKSGLAHFHEHLMFKGTKSSNEGDYEAVIESLGGQTNAFTGADYTGYYVTIATQHLARVMQLEADRFMHLKPKQEHYTKERSVVMEERSQRVENQPPALLSEAVNAALYRHHPYRIPIIGWMHEIEALQAQDAKAFYEEYYHAGNMLLVVSGDITKKQLQKLAETYYGAIPAKPAYARNWLQEPPQRAARMVTLHHSQVRQKRMMRSYMLPSYTTPIEGAGTEYAMPLSLLAQWLGGGKTGMLYQHLVRDKGLAVSASAYYSGLSAGPSEFGISLVPAKDVDLQQLEDALNEVLNDVMTQPIALTDLERIKTLFKADMVYASEGLTSLANYAGIVRILGLPLTMMTDREARIEAVTAQQIQAAAQLLKPEMSVTGYLLPEEQAP